MGQSIELSDDFVYTVNNVDHVTHVTVTEAGILISDGREVHSYRLKYIHLSDVIGAKVHFGAKDNVYLLIHYFPLIKNRFNGKTQRSKKQAILCAFQHDCVEGNVQQCMRWKNAINTLLYGPEKHGEMKPKRRTYLVFVNPKGGKGMAKKMWLNSVKPMLDVGGVVSEVIYTEYSGHAGDYVRDCQDIYKYSAIMTCSGDGIVFEVFNGLMKREDSAKVIKIPLAIIPGGSGNGLCAAILHQSGIPLTLMDAIFVSLRGISNPLDMVKVEQGETIMWSFLSIAWGLLSAVDIESEKMRWMGEARFTVEAVKKLVSFPIKSGKVWFAKVDDTALADVKPTLNPKNIPRNKRISKDPLTSTSSSSAVPDPSPEDTDNEGEEELDPDFDFTTLNDVEEDSDGDSQDIDNKIPDRTRTVSESAEKPLALKEGDECKCFKCQPPAQLDDATLQRVTESIEKVGLQDPIPDSWTLIDGKFATVMAFTLSHLTFSYPVALNMKLDSGFVYLMHTAGGSKKDFLQLLVQNCTPESNETRTIHFEKVRAFRLEPEETELGAYVTIDGELVPYEALHACIYKGIARVLCLPTQ